MPEKEQGKIHILIADDHPIFREGLAKVIGRDARLCVIAEAENGEVAFERLVELLPEVAVLDLDMPKQDGFAVARAVREAHLPVKMIILTSHNNEELFHAALDLGVAGYVLKDGAISEIANAIHLVAKGRNYFSPELSTYLLNRVNRTASFTQQQPTISDLTPTERRVLKLVAEEKTSKEIAETLGVSLRTIEHHRANICEKLNLHGFNALVRFAITHKTELR